MCGIAGYYGTNKIQEDNIRCTLESMDKRGPDHNSFIKKTFGSNNLILMQSRLSILDPSESANQPIVKNNNIMVYNGEIYNYLELRDLFFRKNETFDSSSDTEILFKIVEKFRETNQRYKYIDGMWSFAYFDGVRKELTLSRDYFGEKPLYILKASHGIYFGSTPVYIEKLSSSKPCINYKKLSKFLVYDFRHYDSDNDSFAAGIESVPAGTELRVTSSGKITSDCFFSPIEESQQISYGYQETKERLRDLTIKLIKRRFRSDFPISLFLSGGIDSSLIAYIASQNSKQLNCISIDTRDSRYDEKKEIDRIVSEYSLYHCYLKPNYTADKTFEILQDISHDNYAPIPCQNYLLFDLMVKEAKVKDTKVVMTGLGGDELFAGYLSHWKFYFQSMRDEYSWKSEYNCFLENVAPWIRSDSLKDFGFDYEKVNPEQYQEEVGDHQSVFTMPRIDGSYQKTPGSSYLKRKLNIDILYSTLPPHLRASDMVSMYHSIESRAPFLSKELFEFSRSLPDKYLMGSGYNKSILRNTFAKDIPNEVVFQREKKGFNVEFSQATTKGLEDSFQDIYVCEYLTELIDMKRIKAIMNKETISNAESKLLFRIASAYCFLKSGNRNIY